MKAGRFTFQIVLRLPFRWDSETLFKICQWGKTISLVKQNIYFLLWLIHMLIIQCKTKNPDMFRSVITLPFIQTRASRQGPASIYMSHIPGLQITKSLEGEDLRPWCWRKQGSDEDGRGRDIHHFQGSINNLISFMEQFKWASLLCSDTAPHTSRFYLLLQNTELKWVSHSTALCFTNNHHWTHVYLHVPGR